MFRAVKSLYQSCSCASKTSGDYWLLYFGQS
ncbi:hypothetical protein GIY83_20955 [Flavobacterium sp. SLB02]|nr:hypothetical protein GIY83_20955 [Flavobacterium sp. SLB02]